MTSVPAQSPSSDTPAGHARRGGTISIRVGLLALVVVCTLPATLVAGLAVYETYALRKTRIYETTILTARSVAADLDQELESIGSGLRVLASSTDLVRADLASFHRRAIEALKYQDIDRYVLTDISGNEVLDTSQSYPGALPLPTRLPDLPQVSSGGSHPLVARLGPPRQGRGLTIIVGVPVLIDDEVRYLLFADLGSDRLSALMNRHALGEGWVAALLDRDATILGRTRDEARFVGQRAVSSLADAVRSEREGTLQSLTKEGIPVLTAFSHLATTQWTIAVGAPTAAFTGDLYRAMAWVAGGGLLAILLGLGVAYRLARRIEQAVGNLVEPALALGAGHRIGVPPPHFKETAAVAEAIEHAADTLEHARQLAYYDPLTQLSNRVLFAELARRAIAAAQRSQASLALVAIDLDHFKTVNDVHGHGTGDTVLQMAARRMADAIRHSDVVARYGGDEFMVLLDGAGPAAAEAVANSLVAVLSEPYPGVSPKVGASAGIAVFPHSGTSLEELISRADAALYAAKSRGRNQAVLDPDAGERTRERPLF
ncbi:GGDEF domain-containing protein [Pigmentiphaga sp. H8]|uniref:sensor domain-containing diguanylate cyclase n=1 Tax=Pigmentiphaga sp. H8 TaxID=2488560 RepID=UPI000F5A1EE4|nr:sensor domain-containing diguanylate cyclase [Pigmentiphaga sp. H8]AZG10361.1 GGDEF domain-containing protein [Pigmentiphaga sp. H8]